VFEEDLMTVESRKGPISDDTVEKLKEKLEPQCAKIVHWPNNDRKIVIFGGRWSYVTLCELVHSAIMVHYYDYGNPKQADILSFLKTEEA